MLPAPYTVTVRFGPGGGPQVCPDSEDSALLDRAALEGDER